MKSFCVIIPTLNAGSEISGLLASIRGQSIQPDSIIVIDSSSDDGTADIANEFDGVTVISIARNKFDHGGTRHKAIVESSGDYACFLTQDVVIADEKYFEHLLEPFSNNSVAMVSGRQIAKDDARRYEKLVRLFNYPDRSFVRSAEDVATLGIKAFFASDVCSAYRRSAYFECGGFERPLNTNEDMLMAWTFINNGYQVAYAADACVYHSHNLSLREQFERNRQIGIFLECHQKEFGELNEIGEGTKLFSFVSRKLLKKLHVLDLLRFYLDCMARIIGNKAGKRAGRIMNARGRS